MIDMGSGNAPRRPKGKGGKILPIAIVPQKDEDGLSVGTKSVYQLHVGEAKTFLYLLLANAQKMNGLNEIVAEEMVEFPFCLLYFLLRLCRVGSRQVPPHNLTAIPYNVVEQEFYRVAEYIEDVERKPRQRHQEKGKRIHRTSVLVAFPFSSSLNHPAYIR